MGLFRHRPFALSAFLSAGLATAFAFSGLSRYWLPALILLLFAAVLLAVGGVRRRCGAFQSTLILICLLSSVLLFGSWSFFGKQAGYFEEHNGQTVTAEGVVTECRATYSSFSRFAFDLQEIDGRRVSQKVILNCEYLSALRTGERVRIDGIAEAFAPIAEDSSVAYYLSDGYSGIITCASPDDCHVIASGEKDLFVRLSEWNTELAERLSTQIGGREGGLAAALILGNRNFLSGDDILAFRRVGISHFLALSGLHVGILIAAVERFLRLLRVPRKGRVGVIILLSVVYLAVTGAAPSTVRAVLMALLLFSAFLLRRTYDSPTGVFTALFVILAIQPYAVVDVGLWLSFFAAGGIVIFFPVFRNAVKDRRNRSSQAVHPLVRFGKAFFLAVMVGVIAFCATLPLSATIFGEVSVLSVPATLLLSPLFTVALIFSMLAFLIPIPPITFFAQKVLQLLLSLVNGASEWRGIMVGLQNNVSALLIAAGAILLVLCAVVTLRRKWLVAVPLLLSLAAVFSAYAAIPPVSESTRVVYSAQKGNEYLLLMRGGKAVLLDFSTGMKNYAGDLANAMRNSGCTELEEFALSHYHTSSTWVVARVAEKVKVRTLLLPTSANEEEEAVGTRIEEEARQKGIACKIADSTDSLFGVSLQWVHDPGMGEPAVAAVAKTETGCLVWCNAKPSSAEQTALLQSTASLPGYFLFGQHGSSLDSNRVLPDLQNKTLLAGEWKSTAIPFLPPDGKFYQTVSGQFVFSLP